MNGECRNPKKVGACRSALRDSVFGLRISFVIRHSSFAIFRTHHASRFTFHFSRFSSIEHSGMHIRSMDRRVAPGTPAASLAQKLGMLGIADIHVATAALDLRVALEAQVGI